MNDSTSVHKGRQAVAESCVTAARHSIGLHSQKDSGWKASLNLGFEHIAGKTVLRRSHTGPLLIQRPFYPEGPVCHAYVLHPPSGIVGGDALQIEVESYADSQGLVTTPGASKYYASDGRVASQNINLNVANAALEWMPQETIYFNDCRASQTLHVTLEQHSRFIGWEISCLGRPAGNHGFVGGEVSSRLNIYLNNKPFLSERLLVRGADDLARSTGMRSATTCGTMVIYCHQLAGFESLKAVRGTLPSTTEFSATQIDDFIIIRYLGANTEVARNGFIAAWSMIRPLVIKRPMHTPRIWAT